MANSAERIIVFPSPSTQNPVLDQELSDWGIKLGVSVQDIDLVRRGHSSYLAVSAYPHVFHSKTLLLTEQDAEVVSISDAMIMMGHGVATDANEENWYFLGTGKGVSETVEAYEQVAKQADLPHLDALLVCRNNLRPQFIPNVAKIFRTRGIPYIFADSTVTISLSLSKENSTSGVYKPLEGYELIAADAQTWDRFYLDRWRNYWGHRLNIEDVRQIPVWAKYPANPYG